MPYAIFRCCVTAKHLPEYDSSTDALLSRLNVDAVEIPEFGCCGYPLKNVDIMASLAASARNLALAEDAGKSILTSCACCYGTLLHSARLLKDQELLAKVNESLASEGLSYKGTAEVLHLFHILKDDVGIERIRQEAGAAHDLKKIVLQYGCKLLRPNLSAVFTPPDSEPFFEQLVGAAGSAAIPWELERECCGSGINTTDRALADLISREKMIAAKNNSADGIIAACPFCVLHLRKAGSEKDDVPVLSAAQLLCLALGLD